MLSKSELKSIRSLHRKKYRDENGLYIAEGLKIVEEAMKNQPGSIDRIYITSRMHELLPSPSFMDTFEKIILDQTDYNRISMLKTPQGVMAIMKQKTYQPPPVSQLKDLTLVLDQIADPGNFGTIIRMADWFGIGHVICSHNTVECYNPKVVQASMGAIFRTEISYTSLCLYLNEVKGIEHASIYGTSLNGKNIYQTDLAFPSIVVMGNETRGISDEVAALLDTQLYIPNYSRMSEKTESLNVSVATAVICSEFRRRSG
jgi:TrmH family RNA methyltransferase